MIRIVQAEAIRLASTRIWLWSLVAAVICGGGLTGVIAAIGPENAEPPLPGLDTAEGAGLVLGLVGVTLFVPALIGTTAMTSEYRHRTIAGTFLAVPDRWRVLAAKLVVYAIGGVGYGVVVATTAGLALYGGATARGTTLGVSFGSIAGFGGRIVVAVVVYVLLGVGIGALVRSQVAASGIVIGYFYFFETVLMLVPGVNLVYPYLPGGATSALTSFTFLTGAIAEQTSTTAVRLLSPAGGAAVLLGYALAASVLAVLLPMRRDDNLA